MTRSKLSAGLVLEPPEFFLDRGLGKQVALHLRALGWFIHRITDHFPDDAQDVEDPEWMRYGLERGWFPLCKDGRIKGRAAERRPIEEFQAPMFYLDNQQLRLDEMVRRFDRSRIQIYQKTRQVGAASYAVGSKGIARTWP
ncbi:hypothetical protein [Rhodococcus sp. WWJCD1]|uniref:PIN-like domain-containing protein n=1 Tax=Rhodococcus sp. WWJCD1 TaxID=2022519 RepID=UPI0020CC8D77|nr:hypothetical protein [Rhodococcus sp. WWJCD1]